MIVDSFREYLEAEIRSIVRELGALVESASRGDPISPLRWTCKSAYGLPDDLKRQGHEVNQRTICDLLSQMGFSLRSTRKTREGGKHEDRDVAFAHIAKKTVADYQAAWDPVISVDPNKREPCLSDGAVP